MVKESQAIINKTHVKFLGRSRIFQKELEVAHKLVQSPQNTARRWSTGHMHHRTLEIASEDTMECPIAIGDLNLEKNKPFDLRCELGPSIDIGMPNCHWGSESRKFSLWAVKLDRKTIDSKIYP
ncbi:hypothetical protein CEXT_743231 [Caerostris extrusa]|uniref:Uncharacterized protein n=1 Tax=Caerostris extrusa TaxID=172846 RepID=A0AAV4VTJ8_CAEEX|nr:hypothetical protein CEXT_743231 [Caerostris extrusa]